MSLLIKTEKEDKKKPHLALTHNELQGGAANGRNVSLLLKSGVEITEDVAQLIEKVTGVQVDVNKASYLVKREKLQIALKKFNTHSLGWTYVEDFDDKYVVFANDQGVFYTTYSFNGLEVTVGDEAVSVNRVISYVEDGGKIILSEDLSTLDSGVHSLIVKAFKSLESEAKLVDIFKSKHLERGKQMEVEIQKAVEAATQVLKADLEKAQSELQEAQQKLMELQKSAKEAKDSARKDEIKSVIADESKVEEIFKATETLDDDAFQVILKSFKDKDSQLEGSDLFEKQSKKKDFEKADDEPMHVKFL